MSEYTPSGKSRRLSDIVREVKVAAADRSDVVVDMRDAEHARLDMLMQELEPVFRDVPADDDQFDFALSSGLRPRLWIDAVAHVHMGRDRRTYRFVRDTRLGRALVSETSDAARMADAIARYIAERMVQRQRLLEGDLDSLRETLGDRAIRILPAPDGTARDDGAPPQQTDTAPAYRPDRSVASALLDALVWFLLGTIVGGSILLASNWDKLAG